MQKGFFIRMTCYYLKTELVMVRKDEKINSWTGKLGHYNRFCLKLD